MRLNSFHYSSDTALDISLLVSQTETIFAADAKGVIDAYRLCFLLIIINILRLLHFHHFIIVITKRNR